MIELDEVDFHRRSAALVVVDVQQGFEDEAWWGPRNNPDADSNILALVRCFESAGNAIIFVQHESLNPESPLHPDAPGHRLKAYLDGIDHDLLVTKSVNSSFHGSPDLDRWLRAREIDTVVIAGITTNHCCETTARIAGNLGYQTYFAIDATHTFDRTGPDETSLTADELSRATADQPARGVRHCSQHLFIVAVVCPLSVTVRDWKMAGLASGASLAATRWVTVGSIRRGVAASKSRPDGRNGPYVPSALTAAGCIEPSATVTPLPERNTRSWSTRTVTDPVRRDIWSPVTCVDPNRCAQYGARAVWALPVTGSSAMPADGAK